MFGGSRRHRPPPQPLTRETANPNAATAATSAFMRSEPATTTTLSSAAAAAAALKARPTTPINVAEVPSKRALRRSGSVSSAGSRDRSTPSRDLRRTPSNGSMTERTFRSPSPGGRSPAPGQQEVPPVPVIPHQQQQHQPSPRSPRNSVHLQTQPFRTASQKQKDGQQGSWFGAAAARDLGNVRKSDLVLQTTLPPAGDDRPGSPSINFSYPRGRLDSPTPSPAVVDGQTLVYDANSRRMVPRIDLLARQQGVRDASEKSVKKRKSEVSRSGSHLAKGTVDRVRGTAVESLPSAAAAAAIRPPPEAVPMGGRDGKERMDETRKPTKLVARESKPQSTRTQELVKPEAASTEPAKSDLRIADGATVLPAPDSPRAPIMQQEPSSPLDDETESENETETETETEARDFASSSGGEPSVVKVASTVEPAMETNTTLGKKPALLPQDPAQGQGSRARVDSQSPARSAHFAATTDQLVVRHEPPPRSLSPRKSALKHSNSVRGASPSDDSSEASGSRRVSLLKEESSQARKKAVRVSFNDDSNIVVGESAEPLETDSPIVPSPQAKKPWHSIMTRYSKKESTLLDEEETMTPRPALPLFGSVREKKSKETNSERPLVRPSEIARSSPDDGGASSDAAIGSVLARESSSRNAANISRTREPLPPVVTSIEGNGYPSSDSSMSDDDLEDTVVDDVDIPEVTQTTPPTEPLVEDTHDAIEALQNTKPEQPLELNSQPEKMVTDATDADVKQALGTENSYKADERPKDDIPTIEITDPSPGLRPSFEESPEKEYFEVPGGFPTDDEVSNSAEESAPATIPSIPHDKAIGPSQAVAQAAIPVITAQVLAQPSAPELADPVALASITPNSPMADIREEDMESEESAIYSDAYEDLSDIEGDGFMSLDAVLTAPAPVAQKTPVAPIGESTTSAMALAAQNKLPSARDKEQMPLQTPDDWENAKAYWKSLTVDKRRQLEKEAMEEAGEEADLDTIQKPKKKTKKRRSTDRPTSVQVDSALQPSDPVSEDLPSAPQSRAPKQKALRSKQQDAIAPATPKIRKSMRAEPSIREEREQAPQISGNMRKTLRSGGASVASGRPAPGPRPASYHPSSNTQSSFDGQRPTSSSGAIAGNHVPALKRQGSDSSISSFRRARAATGDGMGFRRSMRANVREPEYATRATKGSGRFSLRSLSPTGFRRNSFTQPSSPPQAVGMSSRMGMGMRQSLRTNSTDGHSSKMRIPTFGRSSGKKAKADGQRGSRFAESSDEDEVRPTHRSRFADSSDEEENLRPVSRGMAKTMRSGQGASSAATAAALSVRTANLRSDSPDLPDSSDEDIAQPKRESTVNGRPAAGLQRSRSGRGTLAAPVNGPGTLTTQGVGDRPAHQRRGSFMASILRRKKDSGGKISREQGESAARRDTRLERSAEQLSLIRSNSSGRNNAQLPKDVGNWPLIGVENTQKGVDVNERPATSAGHGASTTAPLRTGLLKRRSTSQGNGYPPMDTSVPPVPPLPSVEVATSDVGDTPKKKKFGALRKMFRLND